MTNSEFTKFILSKGAELHRDMPWRSDTRPYYILVSELMLQQTQVDRVIPKFIRFIAEFPDASALSSAPLSRVLTLWQGLGYNRRAKFLHQAAHMIVNGFGGQFPVNQEELVSLPGVGKNTAGAISAYAFNQPAIFVETNVRTVYIHHFLADDFDISDKQILELLSKTIDQGNPRNYYWALMDYGTYLKKSGIKNNHQGRHYKKQSPLRGSLREARGLVVKRLAESSLNIHEFRRQIATDDRYEVALEGLIQDGLVVRDDEWLSLAD